MDLLINAAKAANVDVSQIQVNFVSEENEKDFEGTIKDIMSKNSVLHVDYKPIVYNSRIFYTALVYYV